MTELSREIDKMVTIVSLPDLSVTVGKRRQYPVAFFLLKLVDKVSSGFGSVVSWLEGDTCLH